MLRPRSASRAAPSRTRLPDLRTIEIGAGTGVLTRALLEEGADLTALEIDPELVGVLARTRRSFARDDRCGRCAYLRLSRLVARRAVARRRQPSLQYRDAAAARLIEMSGGPASLTVMVQNDVAERFTAAPGTPAYGSLSVAVQYAMHVESSFTLSRRARSSRRRKSTRASCGWAPRASPPSRVRDLGAVLEGRAGRLRVPAQDARQ